LSIGDNVLTNNVELDIRPYGFMALSEKEKKMSINILMNGSWFDSEISEYKKVHGRPAISR